jgi:hypothetical protein
VFAQRFESKSAALAAAVQPTFETRRTTLPRSSQLALQADFMTVRQSGRIGQRFRGTAGFRADSFPFGERARGTDSLFDPSSRDNLPTGTRQWRRFITNSSGLAKHGGCSYLGILNLQNPLDPLPSSDPEASSLARCVLPEVMLDHDDEIGTHLADRRSHCNVG